MKVDSDETMPAVAAAPGIRRWGDRTGVMAACLVFLILAVYAVLPTRNHYWDGIGFALDIEGMGADAQGAARNPGDFRGVSDIYYNPNHLLYNLTGYLLYRPLHAVIPGLRAHDLLRVGSTLLSAGTSFLVFLMLYRWTHDRKLSLWLTLLMAFSAIWWKFSTDADAYIPSTFFLTAAAALMTDPKRTPNGWAVGLLHAIAMLLHQISFFFLPAAIIGLWSHPGATNRSGKMSRLLSYLLAAGVPVAAAYALVWFRVLGLGWCVHEILAWMTSNGSDVYEYRSFGRNIILSVMNVVRLFFGGRVSLALEFFPTPLLVMLAAVMVATLVYFARGMIREMRSQRPDHAEGNPELRLYGRYMRNFALAWVSGFSAFLFFWLTQYPYYRIFFLPALIILLALFFQGRGVSDSRGIGPLPALVAFMVVFNITLYIYPYSQMKANSSRNLAAQANQVWNNGDLILYKDFTCDNWTMRYFNTQTTWRKLDLSDRDRLAGQLRAALESRRPVWVDTTVLGQISSAPEVRELFERNVKLSATWGVADKHYYIQFAQVYPR